MTKKESREFLEKALGEEERDIDKEIETLIAIKVVCEVLIHKLRIKQAQEEFDI